MPEDNADALSPQSCFKITIDPNSYGYTSGTIFNLLVVCSNPFFASKKQLAPRTKLTPSYADKEGPCCVMWVKRHLEWSGTSQAPVCHQGSGKTFQHAPSKQQMEPGRVKSRLWDRYAEQKMSAETRWGQSLLPHCGSWPVYSLAAHKRCISPFVTALLATIQVFRSQNHNLFPTLLLPRLTFVWLQTPFPSSLPPPLIRAR